MYWKLFCLLSVIFCTLQLLGCSDDTGDEPDKMTDRR